jgi:hypothetical protein
VLVLERQRVAQRHSGDKDAESAVAGLFDSHLGARVA